MNPELISLISSSLGYLSALVAQGAVSRIGEGFTESIAELLHEVAHGDRKAERRLATFEDEPDDDSNRERLAQQLAEQLAGNTAAIARLAELLAEVQSAYPHIRIEGEAQVGAVVGRDVGGSVLAPLFSGTATGNNVAEVIHIYQQASDTPDVDYGAALRRYLEHLYRQHATIDLRGIDDRPLDMPLRELYVSLSLHEPQVDDLRGRGALRGFMEKMRSFFGAAEAEEEPADAIITHRSRGTEPVDWSSVLRYPRLAVVGAPGSGKTTLLQYTTVRLAEILARDDTEQLAHLGLAADAGTSRPPVPLLLPLRELGAYLSEARKREVSGANPRLLLDCLAHFYNGFDLDLPPDFFRRLCEAGRAMLLLDGLDEVTRTDERAFVSAIVREFATRYDTCRYVVTARVAAYHGDAQISAGFRICTVADMSAEQQQQFIHNWSRSVQRLLYQFQGAELDQAARRYADDLWQALQMNDRVRDLATNPLLLTVVAVIYHNNYVLPEDRASLYEECVEVLLRGGRGKADRAAHERRQYSGKAELSMGLDPRRELLAAVAYTMHQHGESGRIIERQDLIRTVAACLPARADAHEVGRAFVAELPVHIGLLDEVQPDRFRFSHLSFQEFLAARHVAETDQWDDLLERYHENWWREVILLCAGHLSQARCWRFLERLIEQGISPTERFAVLQLTMDALAELERFKGQWPRNDLIVQQAWGILEAQPARAVRAAARVECGRVLGSLGDPRPGVCTLPPEMVRIAGGKFPMGGKNEAHQVTVATFEIARYPLTNAQWKHFIDDDGYNPEKDWWDEAGRAWLLRDDHATEGLQPYQRRDYKQHPEFWHHERFGIVYPNHPVVGISWYEAVAFCHWLTQHQGYNPDGYVYVLPSEAEWEYAARRATRRTYPWGNEEPDAERANYEYKHNGTSAVGCFPAGATPEDGIHDLAGNVWEWTRSEYRSYPYDPDDGREDMDAPAKKSFTFRGGGWYVRSFSLRASYRDFGTPDSHLDSIGCRLARRLPEA
jgi:formylglycine-generating enzyme required for sulfatase activity